jgi:hypothetical protein
MRKTLCCAAALALTALPTAASDPFAAKGPGRVSCDAFPTEYRARRDLAAWVLGYVSAANRLSPDTFDLAPWQTADVLLAQMAQYCGAFPQAHATDAIEELLDWLHQDRLAAPERPVALRADGAVTVIYPSTLRKVRRLLARAGHAPRPTPEGLTAALTDYQAAQNLPQTGLPDTPTLLSLMQGAQTALEPVVPRD